MNSKYSMYMNITLYLTIYILYFIAFGFFFFFFAFFLAADKNTLNSCQVEKKLNNKKKEKILFSELIICQSNKFWLYRSQSTGKIILYILSIYIYKWFTSVEGTVFIYIQLPKRNHQSLTALKYELQSPVLWAQIPGSVQDTVKADLHWQVLSPFFSCIPVKLSLHLSSH